MKNYLLLLAVAASVSLSSCGNDDDEVTPKTKTELLTASGWKATSLTVSPAIDFNMDGTPDSDLMQFVDACSKDDITTFKTDKTYTEDEGATKCDPADPQVFATGNWTFNGDETAVTLTETGATQSDTYTIAELTENTLKYTQTETISGQTYTFTGTFSH